MFYSKYYLDSLFPSPMLPYVLTQAFRSVINRTHKKWLLMNGKMMTLTFCILYTVYIKKLGQFFLHSYSLTCLNKDTPALLKVINI